MAFADEAWKDGLGRVLRADLSVDGFSTVSYRLGTSAGLLDGTNMYSARIVSVGAVRRGFGVQRYATSGTTELVVDNSDCALNALAGRDGLTTQAKLRVRLYVCLYDPTQATPTFTSKLLGEFVLVEWIRRNNTTLTLQLGDDVLGGVGTLDQLPALRDWEAVGTTATNPLKNGFGRPDVLDDGGYTPIQLAFGEDWVQCLPHLIPIGTVDAAYQNKIIVPLCSTTDTGSGSSDDITNLRIAWLDPNAGTEPRLVDVPRTVTQVVSGTTTTVTVWSVERSPSITKGSKTFKIIYAVVRADLGLPVNPVGIENYLTGNGGAISGDSGGYNPTYESTQFSLEWQGGYPATAIYKMRSYVDNDPKASQYANLAAGVVAWYAKGYPLSARTQTTSPVQHACDVLTDLASYYSRNTSITVDTTKRGRVKAGNPNAACAGVVQPWTSVIGASGDALAPPSLRQVMTKICQSSDLDIFITWDGQLSFSSDVRDYVVSITSGSASWQPGESTTSTATSVVVYDFDDTDYAAIDEWIPGEGERGAPFNRLYFSGGKSYPAEGKGVPFQGPWDRPSEATGIDIADRVVEATLEQGWRPWRQQAFAPWFWRGGLDTVARPRVRFTTSIDALRLDLGDFFRLTWTAGDASDTAGAMYSSTFFQVESIAYAPGSDEVEIEAAWRQDIVNEQQYLLDDETLLVRAKGGSDSLTLYVLLGTIKAEASTLGVNFTSMGVQGGDILILRDSTQAEDEFSRNRAIRIDYLDDDFTLALISTDTSGIPTSPSTVSIANADWSIIRGATTYPTAASDPTNYPSEGDMYGKVTDSLGQYSSSDAGNKLISG